MTIQDRVDNTVARVKRSFVASPRVVVYITLDDNTKFRFQDALVSRLEVEGFRCKHDIYADVLEVRNSRRKIYKHLWKQLTRRFR